MPLIIIDLNNLGLNITSVFISESFDVTLLIATELFLIVFSLISIYKFFSFYWEAFYEKEKKVILGLRYNILSGIFGAVLGYFFVTRYILTYFLKFDSQIGLKSVASLNYTISFLSINIFIYFIIFQIPFFIKGLIKLGVIEKKILKKYRFIYLTVTFIIASIITPSDIISTGLLVIPSYLLYEGGLILSGS